MTRTGMSCVWQNENAQLDQRAILLLGHDICSQNLYFLLNHNLVKQSNSTIIRTVMTSFSREIRIKRDLAFLNGVST